MKTSDQISSGDTLERPMPGLSGGTGTGTGSPAGQADIGPADIGIVADPPEHPPASARPCAKRFHTALPSRNSQHGTVRTMPHRPSGPGAESSTPAAVGTGHRRIAGRSFRPRSPSPGSKNTFPFLPNTPSCWETAGVAALAARTDDAERRVGGGRGQGGRASKPSAATSTSRPCASSGWSAPGPRPTAAWANWRLGSTPWRRESTPERRASTPPPLSISSTNAAPPS